MPRPVSLDDVLALADRMRADAEQRGPLILREEDIARLGEHDANLFWQLVRRARLRSLDS